MIEVAINISNSFDDRCLHTDERVDCRGAEEKA